MGSSYSMLYTPLDEKNAEIRTIHILPNVDPSSQVQCIMGTTSPSQGSSFGALSYVWGDNENGGTITINGHQVRVTTNLDDFLRRIRRSDSGQVSQLWVDAICINQNDPNERSSQANLMRRIYSSATTVFAWFGPDNCDLAFKTISELSAESPTAEGISDNDPELHRFLTLNWLQKYPHLCEEQNIGVPNCPWGAVATFLHAPYWQRVWIFQEVALVCSLIMVSPGSRQLSWPDLSIASMFVALVRRMNQANIPTLGRPIQKPPFMSAGVWGIVSCDAPDMTNIVQWPLVHQIHTSSRLYTEELASRRWLPSDFAFNLKATDPRDCTYGFLGITQLPITPNYSKQNTASDAYVEYASGWLDFSRQRRLRPDTSPLHFLSYGGRGLFIGWSSQPS
ncbi:hypothetical protein OQA88_12666 [Cercophora sp. LCS_1]